MFAAEVEENPKRYRAKRGQHSTAHLLFVQAHFEICLHILHANVRVSFFAVDYFLVGDTEPHGIFGGRPNTNICEESAQSTKVPHNILGRANFI